MGLKLEEAGRKIPHILLVRLEALYDTLKSAEKKAADLLIKDTEYFINSTIVETAKKAGCSEATLVRLARKLGFKGYSELKDYLLESSKDNPIELYEGITERDSVKDIIYKIFESSIQTLKDTLNFINIEDYIRAVDYISNANKILFIGVGDAYPVALSGCQRFLRIGFTAYASADFDTQLIYTTHLITNDVVIAISHSGKTKTIVDVVKYAKNLGIKIISVTNFPLSPLAKHSDIVLLTAAFTGQLGKEVIPKRIAEMCIIESLFINVLLKKRDVFTSALERSNSAVSINKL